MIENEEFRFRPPVGGVADLRALEIFFRLLRDEPRIAIVGLARNRIDDIAERLIVGTAQNGSRQAVVGSGTISRSLLLIAFQPRIDEPSNPDPSLNRPSVSSFTGIVKCCQVPDQIDELQVHDLYLVLLRKLQRLTNIHSLLLSEILGTHRSSRRFDFEEFFDRLFDSASQPLQLPMVLTLCPCMIGHIEHVSHLVQASRNPGGVNRQSKLKHRVGDDVEQPLAVVGEDIDDRTAVRRLVVDAHLSRLRRLGQRFGKLQPGATPKYVVDVLPSFEHCRDAIADGLAPLDRRLPLIIRIGHLKGVDDNTVRPGENLRIEDLQPAPAITPAIFEKMPGVRSSCVITEYSQTPNSRSKSVSTTTSPR